MRNWTKPILLTWRSTSTRPTSLATSSSLPGRRGVCARRKPPVLPTSGMATTAALGSWRSTWPGTFSACSNARPRPGTVGAIDRPVTGFWDATRFCNATGLRRFRKMPARGWPRRIRRGSPRTLIRCQRRRGGADGRGGRGQSRKLADLEHLGEILLVFIDGVVARLRAKAPHLHQYSPCWRLSFPWPACLGDGTCEHRQTVESGVFALQ